VLLLQQKKRKEKEKVKKEKEKRKRKTPLNPPFRGKKFSFLAVIQQPSPLVGSLGLVLKRTPDTV
jgi:hypothetical protein